MSLCKSKECREALKRWRKMNNCKYGFPNKFVDIKTEKKKDRTIVTLNLYQLL